MKKIILMLFVFSSMVYSQNYDLNINLNNDSTVTISVEDIQKIVFKNVTGVEDTEKLQQFIKSFKLKQNYPNPFNPTTTIEYELPEKSNVTIKIFNINGELVKEILNTNQDEGVHQVTWDGTNQKSKLVASGIYLYLVKSDNVIMSKQMILVK